MNLVPMVALVLAVAASCVLLVALLLWWIVLRRAGDRLVALQAQIAGLLGAQQRLEARLETVAAQLQDERACAPVQPAAAAPAYELAAHLASSGCSTEQLVARCGLTPAEAELAVRIHGMRTRDHAA